MRTSIASSSRRSACRCSRIRSCPKGADIATPNGKARFNPVLWLVNRAQDLPSWLTLDSTRVAVLTIGLPDYETRLEAAQHLGNLFADYERGDAGRAAQVRARPSRS